MSYRVEYEWRLGINLPRSFRDRIGDAFRAIASRIDRRYTVAIAVSAKPALARSEQIACINHGLGQIKWALEETTRTQAVELVLAEIIKERHGTPT